MVELCTLLLTLALCFWCDILCCVYHCSYAMICYCFISWLALVHWVVCLFGSVQIIKHSMQREVKQKSLQNLPHAIFIYGTLKRGQPNHYVLEEFGNHSFFSAGCTELRYPLIIDRRSNLPFLLDAPGKGQVCIILFRYYLHYSLLFLILSFLADIWYVYS